MRRPKIGRILGDKATALAGLSELCIGEAKPDESLYNVKDTNVWVLPSGKVPPNPQELLASNRFEQVVAMLTTMFDIVVIDTPPVQLVSDAMVLSRIATEVIYVIKADETPYPLPRQGIRKLQRVGAAHRRRANQLDVTKAAATTASTAATAGAAPTRNTATASPPPAQRAPGLPGTIDLPLPGFGTTTAPDAREAPAWRASRSRRGIEKAYVTPHLQWALGTTSRSSKGRRNARDELKRRTFPSSSALPPKCAATTTSCR